MIFNDKIYKVLKFITLVLLPALGTFYFAIAGVWNLPYAEEIVGSLAAIDAFLGILLGISTANYNKQVAQNTYINATLFEEDPPSTTTPLTSYDIMKWIAQILIPAITTLYFALASFWNLPYAKEIVGSLTAIDAILGAMLGISTAMYNKSTVSS